MNNDQFWTPPTAQGRAQALPAGTAPGPKAPVTNDLMTRKQAANYLGVAEQTLAVWKTRHRYNLPVIKIGRLVKYRKSDLDAFIARRTEAC
jgi:excisionase family DNA binding protein